MNNAKVSITGVPSLDIDKVLYFDRGKRIPPLGQLERRIVAALCAHLAAHGFMPHSVYDGEEETLVYSARGAMELIFNLDEASLRFCKGDLNDWHGVLLVLGNGLDIVSDWNYFVDDRDGFNAVMNSFDAEAFA